MKDLLTPEHRMIATQLKEEARCWPWRRQLIEHHIRELVNGQGDIETVLWQSISDLNESQRGEINAAVRRLRDALTRADEALGNDELGHAETACEQSENILTELRRIGREFGIIHEHEETP